MLQQWQANQALLQNLIDAGCDEAFVEQFFSLQVEEKSQQQMLLLANHRKVLLDKLRASQKAIDCLDYLIYRIKKGLE